MRELPAALTHGLTLVEVLVALLVTSLGIAAFAATARSAANAGRLAAAIDRATALAGNAMEEALALPPDRIIEEDTTTILPTADAVFDRRRRIVAEPDVPLWRIEITVRGGGAAIELGTFRRVPWRPPR